MALHAPRALTLCQALRVARGWSWPRRSRRPPPPIASFTEPEVPPRELVPGRANPVSGLPAEDMGRTPWFIAVPLIPGLLRDVPGRGACAMALSSMSISATPSSSISVSSIQFDSVSARVFRTTLPYRMDFPPAAPCKSARSHQTSSCAACSSQETPGPSCLFSFLFFYFWFFVTAFKFQIHV